MFFFQDFLKTCFSSACGENEFKCEDQNCIDQIFVCDSMVDCPDGSDEKYCPRKKMSNA